MDQSNLGHFQQNITVWETVCDFHTVNFADLFNATLFLELLWLSEQKLSLSKFEQNAFHWTNSTTMFPLYPCLKIELYFLYQISWATYSLLTFEKSPPYLLPNCTVPHPQNQELLMLV